MRLLNSYYKAYFYFFLILFMFSTLSCDDQDQGNQDIAKKCANLMDDDGDDLIDLDDPGCSDQDDDDESNLIKPKQCSDNLDNDNDGKLDINDPGCADKEDDDESDEQITAAQCNNQIDDDNDGQTDYPNDPSCTNRLDDSEEEEALKACHNGIDDDGDGGIDFPADPGCASLNDNDEYDAPIENPLPQCANSQDDDNDGKIDLEDEQCETPADPREAGAPNEERAACSDRIDNDGDGVIDFPNELGCVAAGDKTEENLAQAPLCANALDDDNDGLIDYPFDPGCQGRGDRDETNLLVLSACADRFDNDNDNHIDYPQDIGCQSSADFSETGFCGRGQNIIELEKDLPYVGNSRQSGFNQEGSCGGRGGPEMVFLYRVEQNLEALMIRTDFEETEWETTIYVRLNCADSLTEIACQREEINNIKGQQLRVENPPLGDVYIIVDSASSIGNRFKLQVEEILPAQCLNAKDDDGDGRVDYPQDPGCEQREDRDETDPARLPQCADDEDNDGDLLTDFPLDFGCLAAVDHSEEDLCTQGVRVKEYRFGQAFVIGNQANDQHRNSSGTCTTANGPEDIYQFDLPIHAKLDITLEGLDGGFNQDVALYIRGNCIDPRDEKICVNQLLRQGDLLQTTVDDLPAGTYFIFVDSRIQGFNYKMSISTTALPPSCGDLMDNDDDGLIDLEDIGCQSLEDEFEIDPDQSPACSDQIDNDNDGAIDYPFEIGCIARGDLDEQDPALTPACANRIDDDQDGLIDFENDPGCYARSADDETDPRVRPQCNNRIDDDRDSYIDFPNDPGCVTIGDRTEIDGNRPPQCFDGEDNDRNGFIDYPFDQGCFAAADDLEAISNPLPACSNRLDDDQDGEIDFPFDIGCIAAGDLDESNPNFAPQCGNGRDDDGDERIDFPDDVGCSFAADSSESNDGVLPSRCRDGVDNDRDFLVDLADPGCTDRRDNDESDPPELASCADGIDNDNDMQTDWPADAGCAAFGDFCEEEGYGKCGDRCVPLLDNPLNCGSCGRVCPEGASCVNGSCGGAPVVREDIKVCGFTERDVSSMIVGELAMMNLNLRLNDCTMDEQTQAVLLSRNGLGEIYQSNRDDIYQYLSAGGQIITEYSVSHAMYNFLFDTSFDGFNQLGACLDNIQPVVQFTPEDGFWAEVNFEPIDLGQSGCGMDISDLPDVTFLGGWDRNSRSLGYIDIDQGRLWLVDLDWQDGSFFGEGSFTDKSKEMMSAMILGVGRSTGGGLSFECNDGRDNDSDGLIDVYDMGCQSLSDENEDNVDGFISACADGIDNDNDGVIDFPMELGCATVGDLDEQDDGNVTECSDGRDNDEDGEIDYPFDSGCEGKGSVSELPNIRPFACSNKRDDDSDGFIDFPSDFGCQSAADASEDNDIPTPACANGLDDDRDGIADYPYDRGCEIARDMSEVDLEQAPQCNDGIDNDDDGKIDFPADSGCLARGDSVELTPSQAPDCADNIDNDEDNLIDFPLDTDCRFASDLKETPANEVAIACADGLDNDGDNFVDGQDMGCTDTRLDNDERDPNNLTECANSIDDDFDGLIDWPNDLGCLAKGSPMESQACGENVEVIDLLENTPWLGETLANGMDLFKASCGGQRAPDKVFKYQLNQRSRLTVSVENANTLYPAILSMRTICENPNTELSCVGSRRNPTKTIVLEDALPGEYYITVDGGGPERWQSANTNLALPRDPQGFSAINDFDSNCWNDGGNDAFDCFGISSLEINGERLSLDIMPTGMDIQERLGGIGIRYKSELLGNVWRFSIYPAIEGDETLVDFTMSGNVGSDFTTIGQLMELNLNDRQFTYLRTADDRLNPSDPPIYYLSVPGDPEQFDRISYTTSSDDITITATQVKLPLTIYTAISYLPINTVSDILVRDIDPFAGFAPDVPRSGQFEIQVTQEVLP